MNTKMQVQTINTHKTHIISMSIYEREQSGRGQATRVLMCLWHKNLKTIRSSLWKVKLSTAAKIVRPRLRELEQPGPYEHLKLTDRAPFQSKSSC